MKNITLKIDQVGDLVIGKDGIMEVVEGTDTTAQNARMTLKAWKGDFPLVPEHGTDYKNILGVTAAENDLKEIYREAIFQETDIVQIDELDIAAGEEERSISVKFRASTGKEEIEGEVST